MRALRSIAHVALALALSDCSDPGIADAGPEFAFSETVASPTPRVDLLLAIDNSPSMAQNHTNLFAQIDIFLDELTHPPCVSESDPSPHECTGSAFERLIHPSVSDLHVGVISSDLGTPGSSVPGCENSDLGDDGILNPIRNGLATVRHEPWTIKGPTYARPQDCRDPNQFPSFLTFTSGATDRDRFSHDVVCNVAIGSSGCGLESQLDSIYRALIIHNATDAPGNTSPNAGFLRSDSVLGLLVLSDEEDGSVRDCRFANGTPCDGIGAIDVYNAASNAWASADLNLRFYLYQPCSGSSDPTWTLSRYVDPRRPLEGFLSLKPEHPERIVFGAITGVPIAIPMNGTGTDARVNWDGLLGTPGAGDPEDFCARDSSALVSLVSAEGRISMAQANPDPACPSRVVPACRREGAPVDPTACTAEQQYFAWPARRIVEIARRFDESPICDGGPCRNGLVSSICSSNYSGMLVAFARRIIDRGTAGCLSRAIIVSRDRNDRLTVPCRVREVQAPQTACDPARGRVDPTDVSARTTFVDGTTREVCDVTQIPVDANTRLPVPTGEGWFYSRGPSHDDDCTQRISFTANAAPSGDAIARFECPLEAVAP